MPFDKNQKDFPSGEQKAVWEAGTQILPLEISLLPFTRNRSACETLLSYLPESCKQLQNFLLHILNNAYDNSEIYEPFQFQSRGIDVT